MCSSDLQTIAYELGNLKSLSPQNDAQRLETKLRESLAALKSFCRRCEEAAESCHRLLSGMDFTCLFDEKRKIFSIGLHASDGRRDDSFYDLLASEARLASFVAIGLGQIPQAHWFHLGRQLTLLQGRRVLLSWSASMFEYLMPLLVMRHFPNTLLFETHQNSVDLQISYGRHRRLPWGVSESGYNARDLQQNYQYGPFGLPGLGLKRGLREDLVIAPYATALAALVKPRAALHNFRAMTEMNWLGTFGYYEAADYTQDRKSTRLNSSH